VEALACEFVFIMVMKDCCFAVRVLMRGLRLACEVFKHLPCMQHE